MSSHNDTNIITIPVQQATAKHLRVNSDGTIADAADTEAGTATRKALAAGNLAVRARTASGTVTMVANGVIAKDGGVGPADDGKVTASVGAELGVALTASAADGDWIEVLRN